MPPRPNILFIMTDDQAAWTLSSEGHPDAHTPQLDRLAAQGALTEGCFATGAVCTPSRASALTGRYPSETGTAPDGDVTIIGKDSELGLRDDIPTWPGLLQQAGYTTAMVGKWHLGDVRDEYAPLNKGYDHFSGWLRHGGVSRDPSICVEGEWKDYKGQYTSDVLADLAMDYMRQFQSRSEPFALSLNFWAPHANHAVPDDFTLPYNDRTWLPLKEEDLAPWRDRELTLPHPDFPNLDVPRVQRMVREYLASMHSADRNIGRILDFLDTTGLTENTIVIHTADHGYFKGHNGLLHKGNGWWMTRDGKDPAGVYGKPRDNLFDHAIRVPGIIRWPGVIAPGTRVAECVSFVDWLPTLMDMTGLAMPSDPGLRGRSFLPLLTGRPPAWDNTLFAQHRTLRACRTPPWKLVRDFSGRHPDELYHLAEDPSETRNLINRDTPAVRAITHELDQRLQAHMSEIGDPLLQSQRDG